MERKITAPLPDTSSPVISVRACSMLRSARTISSARPERWSKENSHISPNYYDDLHARFGLDAEMIDRLRANNILYDRDSSGEYFQLYSPVFGEGFFLEVVQRSAGYSGYGAPNAIFRIASQRRILKPDIPV